MSCPIMRHHNEIPEAHLSFIHGKCGRNNADGALLTNVIQSHISCLRFCRGCTGHLHINHVGSNVNGSECLLRLGGSDFRFLLDVRVAECLIHGQSMHSLNGRHEASTMLQFPQLCLHAMFRDMAKESGRNRQFQTLTIYLLTWKRLSSPFGELTSHSIWTICLSAATPPALSLESTSFSSRGVWACLGAKAFLDTGVSPPCSSPSEIEARDDGPKQHASNMVRKKQVDWHFR